MSRPCDRAPRQVLAGHPVGYPDVAPPNCDLCNATIPLEGDATVTVYACQRGEVAEWTVRLFCPACDVT